MRILLSNDDGYFAPGLAALAEGLAPGGDHRVAPERDRSGASNSLTLDRPLMLRRAPQRLPVRERHAHRLRAHGGHGLLDFEPDVIVSGINSAPTWATTRSIRAPWRPRRRATCWASRDRGVARRQRVRALRHRGARGPRPRRALARAPFGAPVLLNVNVPDIPYER
jgi:5'-nucleotidase